MGKYHLMAKPHKRARNKTWYVWWYDQEGKRKSKNTGYSRKSDAEELIKQWEREEAPSDGGPLLKSFAENFFTDPDSCPYLAWHPNLKPQTIYGHRNNLERILKRFGDTRIKKITDYEFEQWLIRLRKIPKKKGKKTDLLSGSSRNSIVETYMIIMREAKKLRLVDQLPEISRSERGSRHRDILTEDELNTLFPGEEVELHERWSLTDIDRSGYMFGLMAKVQLQGGMRPGEIRALKPEQLFPQHNTIYIVHQLDSRDRIAPLKKASSDDKRLRFVRIPATTMDQLQRWVQFNEIGEDEFIFTFDGDFVRKDYYRRRFQKVLRKNGIESGDRWLTPYTLRYTFRSRMHGNMDLKTIMDMMGHRSEEVSENYLQINPEMFKVFEVYQEKIDNIW